MACQLSAAKVGGFGKFAPSRLWICRSVVSSASSGTGKATALKFGRYIYRVHPNKSPLKFSRKGTVGVSRDSPIFGIPPIISGTGKATDVKYGRYIYRVHPSKSPLKNFEKRDRGRIQGLPNFGGYPLLSHERVKPRTSNSADTLR